MSTKFLMILVAIATLAAGYFIQGYNFNDPNYNEYLRRKDAGITDDVDKPPDAKPAASGSGHSHPTKLVNAPVFGPDGQLIAPGDGGDASTQPTETYRSKFFSQGQPMEGTFLYDPDPSDVDPGGPKNATLILHEDCTFLERVTPLKPDNAPAVERTGKYRLFDNTLELTYAGDKAKQPVSLWIYPIGAEDMYGRPPKIAIDGKIYRLERE